MMLLATMLVTTSVLLHPQQLVPYERLSRDQLDVSPPSARVSGSPGELRVVDRSCRNFPAEKIRQRIVEIAVQEWKWFGSSVIDMTSQEELERNNGRLPRWWRTNWMNEQEAWRVSDDIAGYWAAAPNSSWIVEKQNRRWNELGITARWRDFWSAAFVSWVMCESGLGKSEQFARAIAHHTYIDQAIRARDGLEQQAAFTAYDVGEAEILPGDLLCRGSRPAYRNLDERREHMGEGARSHCDIVVEIQENENRLFVIGGNVRGSVRAKLLPGVENDKGLIQPAPYGGRRIFSHLKLNVLPDSSKVPDNFDLAGH